MKRLLLIGIGSGDPDQVTVQAVHALDAFDVLFVVTKDGADELVCNRLDVLGPVDPVLAIRRPHDALAIAIDD